MRPRRSPSALASLPWLFCWYGWSFDHWCLGFCWQWLLGGSGRQFAASCLLGSIDVCYAALTPPLFLPPDLFQAFAELSSTLGPRQVTSSKHAADPPHLKAAKHQGDQSKLDISPIHLVHFSNRLLNRVGCCRGDGVPSCLFGFVEILTDFQSTGANSWLFMMPYLFAI